MLSTGFCHWRATCPPPHPFLILLIKGVSTGTKFALRKAAEVAVLPRCPMYLLSLCTKATMNFLLQYLRKAIIRKTVPFQKWNASELLLGRGWRSWVEVTRYSNHYEINPFPAMLPAY